MFELVFEVACVVHVFAQGRDHSRLIELGPYATAVLTWYVDQAAMSDDDLLTYRPRKVHWRPPARRMRQPQPVPGPCSTDSASKSDSPSPMSPLPPSGCGEPQQFSPPKASRPPARSPAAPTQPISRRSSGTANPSSPPPKTSPDRRSRSER